MTTSYDLTARAVAGQLHKSVDWVRLHSKFQNPALPILPAVKVLGRYRWSQADIDEFVKANTQTKD